MHTSQQDRYVVFYPHCTVQFMERPKTTKRKEKYREPKVAMTKRFKSWKAADDAHKKWLGKLL